MYVLVANMMPSLRRVQSRRTSHSPTGSEQAEGCIYYALWDSEAGHFETWWKLERFLGGRIFSDGKSLGIVQLPYLSKGFVVGYLH